MANFRYTPFAGSVDTEFEFPSLYMHHIYLGANPTQSDIIAANTTTGWGSTQVNNWTVYDGVGPDAKLVARAQGLHIDAGSWHNTFTLRFEIERFKKSTLQVMGASVHEGEWSIVGGTGELAMASGIIKKKPYGSTVGGEIIELSIHGFCCSRLSTPAQGGSSGGGGSGSSEKPTAGESGSSGGGGTSTLVPPPPPNTLTKSGPWGGSVGSDVDSEKPTKVKSIVIRGDDTSVDSFEYSYVDQNGKTRTAGPWGNGEKIFAEIKLGPDEVLTEVSGEASIEYVYTLKFVTNKKTYGPYGTDNNSHDPFGAIAPAGKEIVGFFGRTRDKYLAAIGVYIA